MFGSRNHLISATADEANFIMAFFSFLKAFYLGCLRTSIKFLDTLLPFKENELSPQCVAVLMTSVDANQISLWRKFGGHIYLFVLRNMYPSVNTKTLFFIKILLLSTLCIVLTRITTQRNGVCVELLGRKKFFKRQTIVYSQDFMRECYYTPFTSVSWSTDYASSCSTDSSQSLSGKGNCL